MKSIPLALTWEFWRRASGALFLTVTCLFGLMALIYGGLQAGTIRNLDAASLTSFEILGFIFVAVGLSAAICHSSGSPQYRFSLPVTTRTSILIPLVNGAIATAVGYLTIALLVNWTFDARWTLVKPTITAICMISVCQSVGWMCGASANLRSAIDAGICTLLGIVVLFLNAPDYRDHVHQKWHTLRALDISLAIVVPISAYSLAFIVLALARRGQVFSVSAVGSWLLAKLDIRFGSGTCAATPMAAELWSEWTLRGRILLAGPILIAATLCGFFVSGRFAWESARDAIAAFTWLQLMIGSILVGLFIGHVGERFDFHEYSATRPLSDSQLADVKLRNALKVVCSTWLTWAIGVAVSVVCLTLVGQGPKSWSDIVPPRIHTLWPVIVVVMIPLWGWTMTSLGVSIAILRAWMLKTLLCTLAMLPAVPYAVLYLLPDAENEVFAAFQWSWICFTVGGTFCLYVTAFRLRLITAKRIAIMGVTYLLFCATWLSVFSFLPSPAIPRVLAVGFLMSNCILPFVCVAAVPLAIWWNRHR